MPKFIKKNIKNIFGINEELEVRDGNSEQEIDNFEEFLNMVTFSPPRVNPYGPFPHSDSDVPPMGNIVKQCISMGIAKVCFH